MADFSRKILSLDGKTIPFNTEDGAAADATVGVACVAALLNDNTGSQTAEEKARRFVLAQRIASGGNLDLSAEDTALCKKVVGNMYSPLVVGRVFEAIDPAALK